MSWYLMHRGWQDDPFFKKENFTEREAWEWLISEASYDGKKKFNIAGTKKVLPIGELSFSYSFLAEAWGWQKSRISRYVKRLEEWGMIETKMERRQTIISVCNYSKFQLKESKDGTKNEPPIERNMNQLRNKPKEVNKGNEVNELLTGEFEQFWKSWNPYDMSKGNKKMAMKKYETARKKVSREVIEKGRDKYIRHCHRAGCKTQHVATWLNNNGWEFETEENVVRIVQSPPPIHRD